jgi:hypothetical protein
MDSRLRGNDESDSGMRETGRADSRLRWNDREMAASLDKASGSI